MSEEDNRTLWVGNLSDDVCEELLYELFLQAGPLEKVTLPKEKNGSGKKRGYAFICFHHDVSVPYAYNLMNGINLCGRTLRLQYRPGSSHDAPSKSSQSSPYQSPDEEADHHKYVNNPPNTPFSSFQQQQNQQSKMVQQQQLNAVQQYLNRRGFNSNYNDRNNTVSPGLNNSNKSNSPTWNNANSPERGEFFNTFRSNKDSYSNRSPYRERENHQSHRPRPYDHNTESKNYHDRESVRDRRDVSERSFESNSESQNYRTRENMRDRRDFKDHNGKDFRRPSPRYSNFNRNVR